MRSVIKRMAKGDKLLGIENVMSADYTYLLKPRPSIRTTIQLSGASASHCSCFRTFPNLCSLASST